MLCDGLEEVPAVLVALAFLKYFLDDGLAKLEGLVLICFLVDFDDRLEKVSSFKHFVQVFGKLEIWGIVDIVQAILDFLL